MQTLMLLSETVTEEEVSALPIALSFAGAAFVLFAILLLAITRLNPDR